MPPDPLTDEPICVAVEWVGDPQPPPVGLTVRERARGHHLVAADIKKLLVGFARSDVPPPYRLVNPPSTEVHP